MSFAQVQRTAIRMPFFYTFHAAQEGSAPKNVPIAVVKGNHVLELSPEALRAGAVLGSPLRSLLLAVPSLHVVHYRTTAYEAAFDCVCQACAHFSPVVEPVLPHLIFVDLTGCQSAIQDLVAAVSAAAGIPACAGIASSIWVARCTATYLSHRAEAAYCPSPVSNHQQSKKGPTWLQVPVGKEAAFLAPLSVQYLLESDLPEAPALMKRLVQLEVGTLGELASLSLSDLTGQFGTKIGPRLYSLATGKDPTPIRPLYPPDQVTVFFRTDAGSSGLIDAGAIDQVLVHLSTELSAALSVRGKAARKLSVEVTLQGRTLRTTSQLKRATLRYDALLRATRRLWTTAQVAEPVLGLRLHGESLETPPVQQTEIFNDNLEVAEGLARALHYVHNRFGTEALRTAGKLPLSRRELVRDMWERQNL